MMSIRKLRKELNELKKSKGSSAVPFKILDKFVNGVIDYNEALRMLEKENPPFADMQLVIIKSTKDLDEIHEDNREYLKSIFKELDEEQRDKK